jgi:hypothetical protein
LSIGVFGMRKAILHRSRRIQRTSVMQVQLLRAVNQQKMRL